MYKHLVKGSLAFVLIFLVACTKDVKKDDAAETAPGSESAAISQEAMNFNAAGSDSGTVVGLSTINFAYDSAVIDAKARGILKSNADWIKTNAKVSIQIEGHCDSRGSVEYNLALGERRAKAVSDYIASLGIDRKRLSIISFGKEKPLDNSDSEDAMARNRRANFVPLAN